jgi:hypothetical protein
MSLLTKVLMLIGFVSGVLAMVFDKRKLLRKTLPEIHGQITRPAALVAAMQAITIVSFILVIISYFI